MSAPIIQFKRGLFVDLPGLRIGEPGFTTDAYDLFVGIDSTTNGNKFFGSHRYWDRENGTRSLGVNLVDKSGNNKIQLKSPNTLSGITTYVLPETPLDGYFLKTNATGDLSWASLSNDASFTNATISGISTISGVLTISADTLVTGIATFNQTISGTISTATRSTLSDIAAVANNQDYNVIFSAGSGIGKTLGVDAELLYNPNTNTLSFTNAKVQNVKASDGTEAITIESSTGNVGINSNLTVNGNLFVNGSTTQVNTTSISVEDRTVELGKVAGVAATTTTWDLGVLFNYGDTGTARKSAVIFESTNKRFAFAQALDPDSDTNGNSNPQLTVATYSPIEIGSLWVNDCAGQSQVISCAAGIRKLENITIDCGSFWPIKFSTKYLFGGEILLFYWIFMTDTDLKEIIAMYQKKTFELFNQNIVLETQVKQLQSKTEELLEKLSKYEDYK